MNTWTHTRLLLLLLLCAATMGGTCMMAAAPQDMPPGDMQPVGMPADGVLSFADHILPIFTSNCASCHQPGGFADDQGITMYLTAGSAYAAIVNQPSDQNASLTRVIPSDSANSLLFLKISSDNPPVGLRMPFLRSPLSQTQISLIRDWIDQGAQNN